MVFWLDLVHDSNVNSSSSVYPRNLEQDSVLKWQASAVHPQSPSHRLAHVLAKAHGKIADIPYEVANQILPQVKERRLVSRDRSSERSVVYSHSATTMQLSRGSARRIEYAQATDTPLWSCRCTRQSSKKQEQNI